MEIDTLPAPGAGQPRACANAQVQAVSEASMPVAGHVLRPQQKLPPAHSLKHKSSPPALSLLALKQAQPRTSHFRFYHETEVVASSLVRSSSSPGHALTAQVQRPSPASKGCRSKSRCAPEILTRTAFPSSMNLPVAATPGMLRSPTSKPISSSQRSPKCKEMDELWP